LEFLLEYLLNILLFLLQNRTSMIIKRLSVDLQTHLLEHAEIKLSIQTHMRNLLEVSASHF